MIYQPILDRSTKKSGELCYHLRHMRRFEEPGDPQHDESHIHSCYEIYFNLAGDVSFWANNRLYRIKSGDMIATKPGDVHLCVYNSPSVHEHFCLWLDFSANSSAAEYISDFFSKDYYSFGEKKDDIAKLLTDIEKADGENQEFLQAAAIFALIAYLGEKGKAHSTEAPVLMPAEMQRIVDDLNENFAEFNHINDITERYYISRATLNRWFRKYLHISPRDFLEAKKLSFAKKLLSDGKTVTEACMLSGFSDCSYFISVFKRKFGETPLKYKMRT